MRLPIENRSVLRVRSISMMLASLLILNSVVVPLAATAQNFAGNTSERQARTVSPRRVLVRSKSLLVRAAVVEDKLLKRAEFKELGFVITRDDSDADIILELRHDLLTKYVFSVVDVRTQTVIASGKLSSLGGTVAGKVAKRFLKAMAKGNT